MIETAANIAYIRPFTTWPEVIKRQRGSPSTTKSGLSIVWRGISSCQKTTLVWKARILNAEAASLNPATHGNEDGHEKKR